MTTATAGAFRAFRVDKTEDRRYPRSVVERDVDALPEGDLLIDVAYSSLNYKDALSATGNPGVTRNFPHTPGIDAAGTVVESVVGRGSATAGTEVIVIGFDLGHEHPRRIRPEGSGFRPAWAVADARGPRRSFKHDSRHRGLHCGAVRWTSCKTADMTAGGRARCSSPARPAVLVQWRSSCSPSWATRSTQASGKADRHDYLRGLGASTILSRRGPDRPVPTDPC